MNKKPTFMIVAGEVSGDMHAAGLVSELRKREPGASFFGIGGPAMRAAGVETVRDTGEMAVMGFAEVLGKLRFFKRVMNEMAALARERRPDAVILVDYPGFNLKLAERVHGMGLRTIYYICPQVWAWRRSRIPKMAKNIDLLITIFPFEKQYFEGTGLPVEFVGHPLVDEAAEVRAGPEPAQPWKGEPRVALLPGSRVHVVKHIFPLLWQAAEFVQSAHPKAGFIVAAANPELAAFLEREIKRSGGGPSRWAIVTGDTRHVLRQARAAMTASGTATIEASLMSCPMAVVYSTSLLTYLVCRLLVQVDNIGMVNIVAEKQVCPELIQAEATPRAIAQAVLPLLGDEPERAAMVEELERVNARLGPPGAAGRAAEVVVKYLGSSAGV